MELRLGLYNHNAQPKRTPLGITVYTHDLDDYGPKRVRKTCNRMLAENVEQHLVDQFREWALRLPAELLTWIDGLYCAAIHQWSVCVGHHLPDGSTIKKTVLDSITPASFTIRLQPGPFQTPQGILTAGASWTDRIEVLAAYLGSENTWLRKCDDLIAWELGNLIALRHDYHPSGVAGEVGNRSPCSL